MPKRLPFIYGFQFNEQSDLTSIAAILALNDKKKLPCGVLWASVSKV